MLCNYENIILKNIFCRMIYNVFFRINYMKISFESQQIVRFDSVQKAKTKNGDDRA